ncbi:MAG: adenylate kinase [Candidatus Edwardsbacteria bacterium]|nr:adenylate kinase [Candidatus Edwardsbacteria bacterium]
MRLVLLGAPGSGKGTQANYLAKDFAIPHISTGDILREAVRNGTALGLKAKTCMEQGALVPDGLMLDLVRERLAQPDAQKGFLLDGFPRTVAQADGLDQILGALRQRLDTVISLEVESGELIKRLTARWSCPKCGAIFNLISQPPRLIGICDACGTALEQRPDDRRETVENRLKVYESQTAPLKAYYGAKGWLLSAPGDQAPESVYRSLKEKLPSER